MSDLAIDATILTIAAVAANLFVLGYFALAPWYRSAAGRASWISMLALALLLDLSLVAYWIDWTVPEWLARIIYVAIALGAWLKFAALLHEQIFTKTRKP